MFILALRDAFFQVNSLEVLAKLKNMKFRYCDIN